MNCFKYAVNSTFTKRKFYMSSQTSTIWVVYTYWTPSNYSDFTVLPCSLWGYFSCMLLIWLIHNFFLDLRFYSIFVLFRLFYQSILFKLVIKIENVLYIYTWEINISNCFFKCDIMHYFHFNRCDCRNVRCFYLQ